MITSASIVIVVIVIFLLFVGGFLDRVTERSPLSSDCSAPAAEVHSPTLVVEFCQLSLHQLVLDLFSESRSFMLLHNFKKDLVCVPVSEHLHDAISIKSVFQSQKSVFVGPI